MSGLVELKARLMDFASLPAELVCPLSNLWVAVKESPKDESSTKQ